MNTTNRIYIGTSGWHYDHWNGPFYPDDMKDEDYLAFYCSRFDTVEINNSFYQLPEESTLDTWRSLVPGDFTFAVKASRYITHMKKLKEPVDALKTFLGRCESLGENAGPVLFQLPPRWHVNVDRLRSFLDLLPRDLRYTFEFRDESWFVSDVFDALEEHNAAFCIYELDGRESPHEVTAGFVYIRLHGPGAAYQGSYDDTVLGGWAGALSSWAANGKDVYCYFDNDQHGFAPQNALRLKEMTGG